MTLYLIHPISFILSYRLYKNQNSYNFSKGVFVWKKVSALGRASPLWRDPASQLNSLSKYILVSERRASPPWPDLAID